MNESAAPQGALTLSTDDNLDFYKKFDETHGKESRKKWYNDATHAYVEARPRYPDSLVQDSLKQAKLLPVGKHHILEVGCGPGTATLSLAKLGYKVTAIDPAPQNCIAARKQCQEFSENVDVVESTFEDYQHPTTTPISAILCPTSFHWITPEVACKMTAELLRPTKGCMLLWWALPPLPSQEICNQLQDIYDDLDESKLGREIRKYGTKEFCQPNLEKFREVLNESGYYQPNHTPLHLQSSTCYYSPEKFITLLSTLSPYIALSEERRLKLFERLLERLKTLCQESNQSELELTGFFGSQCFWVKP